MSLLGRAFVKLALLDCRTEEAERAGRAAAKEKSRRDVQLLQTSETRLRDTGAFSHAKFAACREPEALERSRTCSVPATCSIPLARRARDEGRPRRNARPMGDKTSTLSLLAGKAATFKVRKREPPRVVFV